MDFKWIKVLSWHALQHESKVIDGAEAPHTTYCGRNVVGEIVDILPDEKSCESCLRITARLSDAIGAL